MKQLWLKFTLMCSVLSWALAPLQVSFSQTKEYKLPLTPVLSIQGTIGPATLDYVQRGRQYCERMSCTSILLEINTPGGSLQSTRLIVEEILASPVPFLCFISPDGARAGSAGAIIMQACHVSGALKTTNIGAATPVSGQGAELPADLRKKLVEDTRSWVKSLAELRNRSEEFAEKIVTEALALNASEAQRVRGIDFVGDSQEDFLKFAQGREVELSKSHKVFVEVGAVQSFSPDFRYHVLDQLTDPQVAYMILMGSLGLLYYELTHPGAIVPGVVGALGLVVSLVSLHKLDVWWGGILLIFLGMVFLIAEAFTPSFGFLGVGGFISFVLGSVFLYDPVNTGYILPIGFLIPVLLMFLVVVGGVAYLAIQSRNVKRRSAEDSVVGQEGVVVSVEESGRKGQGRVLGEIWSIESRSDLQVGANFEVKSIRGLVLEVESDKI